MRIAFLGMGLMGAPMAARCLAAGHDVAVWNRTAAKSAPLATAGAQVAASPAEAAAGREAVLLCVEDTPDVEQVLFGPEGVAAGLMRPPRDSIRPPLVIDHSTISAEATAGFAERIGTETGAIYLDAPVSGGDIGARAGTLAIMVGGPVEGFERARPLLEVMGKTIVHIGTRSGDGQRAKMVNQMVVAINCIATTEAMRLCEGMGLEGERVLAAIGQGAAASWSLNNLGPRLLARDWRAGFRARHLLKDLGFCQEAIARLTRVPERDWPGAALAFTLFQQTVEAGHGDENIHALARPFLERRRPE